MKLAIGTAQFSENYGISNNRKCILNNEIKKIFNICEQNKINIFDKAYIYKNSINKIKENIIKYNNFVDKIIVGISSKNELIEILKIYNKKFKKIVPIKKYKILEKKYTNPAKCPQNNVN